MSNEEFYHTPCPHPGSNREPSACEANAVTTIMQAYVLIIMWTEYRVMWTEYYIELAAAS